MKTVGEILQVLEQLAPLELAESWDNVGLIVGDREQRVHGVMVALDVTPAALDQAAEAGAGLLVVHHPLIFSGLKRLQEDHGVSTLVRRLIREGRSLIVMHTNLDSAPRGLNQYLAEMLGLLDIRPLLPGEARPLYKLVVYVPSAHLDAVRDAICAAGAGHIGQYSECTFAAQGIGTFRPPAGGHPYIGHPGVLEQLSEMRLETVLPRAALAGVLAAMQQAHPYEEVAYDLFPLDLPWPGAGLGRVGRTAAPMTLAHFTAHVREVLSLPRLTLVGDPTRLVEHVALCSGSGGDFLPDAVRAGADLYLTAELKHHQALLARQQGIAVIDPGHYASEIPAIPLIADFLEEQMSGLQVARAEDEDPIITCC